MMITRMSSTRFPHRNRRSALLDNVALVLRVRDQVAGYTACIEPAALCHCGPEILAPCIRREEMTEPVLGKLPHERDIVVLAPPQLIGFTDIARCRCRRDGFVVILRNILDRSPLRGVESRLVLGAPRSTVGFVRASSV